MSVSPQRPDLPGVIRDLRGRVDSLERAPVAVAGPHRVCITAAGSAIGFSGTPKSTPWRPWTAVSLTDLWAETTEAVTGMVVGVYANDLLLASVTFGTSTRTAFASFGPVTVDVFDRVDFRITTDTDGPGVWRGITMQALGTSAHPVSAGLVLIDAGDGV